LSDCEDYTDTGVPVDGYTDPNLGILVNNVPNGEWDGDRRILNQLGWSSTTMKDTCNDLSNPECDVYLSPFNIDGDDAVELPFASYPDMIDPASEQPVIDGVSYRYTKGHVLKHTITHEIVHALAGPSHTEDPGDLMYKYSNNWSRFNQLSDYYRSLLRIHNKKRW